MSAKYDIATLATAVLKRGFDFVDGQQMDALLDHVLVGPDWEAFASSWNDLVVDGYLAERGTYRRRRHAVFSLSCDGIATREPHRPHFQSKTYNSLQGGIQRWFEPITPDVADSEILHRMLGLSAKAFGQLAPAVQTWNVEVHQFRIEANATQPGLPTPEGIHRDGVDYVLVSLVNRTNLNQGVTTIHDAGGMQLGSFTLTRPFDSAFVDDRRVLHGVTPVIPDDPAKPAFRDVLVITLARPANHEVR